MESAEDHMNHMATDILECPKCESEDLELAGIDYFEYASNERWFCKNCGHDFVHTQ